MVIPPDPHNRARLFAMLVVSLLVCVTPLLINLGDADTTRSMEKITLLTSRETWQTCASEGWRAAIKPTWNGRPRINKPPMTVWLNMLAWSDLNPRNADPDTLVWRARIVGVTLALLALASTFWAGMSLGDVRVASLAAMITGTMLIFVRQSRIGSYDTHLLAWTTLAVASGLWAMRPLRPTSHLGRRVLGWLLAGVALGIGVLSKSPIAAVLVGLPLLSAVIVTRHRRTANLIGLTFAMCLGCLIAAPWYLYISETVKDAPMQMAHDFRAARNEWQPVWYYIGLFGLVFPWTVWLIGSLFQPFVRAAGERRRQLLIAWLWFVVLFVFFSVPQAKQQRYIVPLLPAAGLMIAQVWAWHAQQASEGQQDLGVNVLRIPHWAMLIGGSIALPVLLARDALVVNWLNAQGQAMGWSTELDQMYLPHVHPAIAVGVGIVLLGLALVGLYWHAQWKPTLAALATVGWMVVAASVGMSAYANSQNATNPWRADAEKVARMVGGHAIYYLQPDPNAVPQLDLELNEEFLFYAGRVVKPLTVEDLDRLIRPLTSDDRDSTMPRRWPLYIIIRADDAYDRHLKERGFEKKLDFEDGTVPKRSLYRRRLPIIPESDS
ncbi:MAG: hypothetical protein CMJ49_03435 [Planctomycetaceae bacterium]|nr:hypothetical protein [Planctomycetaceae bacterium]